MLQWFINTEIASAPTKSPTSKKSLLGHQVNAGEHLAQLNHSSVYQHQDNLEFDLGREIIQGAGPIAHTLHQCKWKYGFQRSKTRATYCHNSSLSASTAPAGTNVVDEIESDKGTSNDRSKHKLLRQQKINQGITFLQGQWQTSPMIGFQNPSFCLSQELQVSNHPSAKLRYLTATVFL